MKLFRIFFRRRKRVVDLPELCGKRLGLSEVKALLHGAKDDLRVRALLQVLAMRRQACDEAAATDAWKGQDSRYQQGGRQSLDDAFTDLALLLESGKTDDEMKKFFAET